MIKSINAEIVTIGDEILFGQIIDTNSSWIGAELSNIGIQTLRRASVGDTESEIIDGISLAMQRADIVIVTGGLGPTKDDITKHTLCKIFKCSLKENEEALTAVIDFFAKRGRVLSEINKGQALLPTAATYIRNDYGTAPGMWFEKEGKIVISLPGVPSEMKGIMTDQILPKFKKHFDLPVIYHKIIRITGIGESYLAELIEDWETQLPQNIKLAYLPSYGELKLRLTAKGDNVDILKIEVEKQIELIKPIIHPYIYGYDKDELLEVVGQILKKQGCTIATAESCTGGYLSHLFTSVSGSSEYFLGGIVSYDNKVKIGQLGVKDTTLDNYGAVSEQTIIEMAEGIRTKLGTDIGLATSGIAGPNGGTPDKPVGTVWIALSAQDKLYTKKLQLGGNRLQNIQLSAFILVNLLRKYLLNEDPI